MATELKRNKFGMTSKGQVVVIEKQVPDDHGSKLVSYFEVKHGVRTIGEYDAEATANAIAAALMKERDFVEPVDEPIPASMAANVAATRERVSRGPRG